MINWEKGRQGTNYLKKKLLGWRFFDLYLLKFPKGTYVPPHRDLVEGKNHYRINFLLRGRDTFYIIKGRKIFHWWRVVFFRSDEAFHALGKVDRDTYILSLGIVTKRQY